MKNNGQGFTLVELMITGAVLVVMATMALPNYFTSLEAGRLSEAKTNLQIIYTGQKVYTLNNPSVGFWLPSPTTPTVATVNSTLNVDIGSKFYDVGVFTTGGGPPTTTFTARVTRNTTSGGSTSTFYTIDQLGVVRDKNSAVVP